MDRVEVSYKRYQGDGGLGPYTYEFPLAMQPGVTHTMTMPVEGGWTLTVTLTPR